MSINSLARYYAVGGARYLTYSFLRRHPIFQGKTKTEVFTEMDRFCDEGFFEKNYEAYNAEGEPVFLPKVEVEECLRTGDSLWECDNNLEFPNVRDALGADIFIYYRATDEFEELQKNPMKIRALSLWEPWASAIALNKKSIETRTWETEIRGPLLICAGLKENKKLRSICKEFEERGLLPKGHPYHRGCAVAVADLVLCRKMTDLDRKDALYEEDWDIEGKYSLILENITPIQPFPVKGGQKFFFVTINDEIEKVLGKMQSA